jgi:hypothetical protein
MAAAPAREAPKTPAGEEATETPGADAETTTTTNQQFAQPPGSTKEKDEDGATDDSLASALALFDRSASELSEAVLDCGKACKALGSMERSMGRICDLVGPDDPERRCETAKEKTRVARARVEKHCPRCE